MEFLEGENLAQMLERLGSFPPSYACSLVVQLCEALATAHARGIIHRDLKPENLFLIRKADGTEWLKVLDFGIAKFCLDAKATTKELTSTGATLGTGPYMAPEQILRAREVDYRVDIYATGVILYELLTGQRPFSGENYEEIVVKIATNNFS